MSLAAGTDELDPFARGVSRRVGRVTPAGGPPASLEVIAAHVESRVDELLESELRRWRKVDASLGEPLTALRELVLAGGKRLRPAFCHWAYVGAGGDATSPLVVDAGAALELLHTFALIHDDVMDGSATRRAIDTVHVRFQQRHARDGWRGEGRRFGEGVAVLLGDLAFVYADLLLADAPRDAIAVFTELRLEVNVGQYLDLAGTARGGVAEDAARRISLYKSGKYTVERPLHLGAALAGRLDDLAGPLTAYGVPLGEAFQLRDDLLGVLGDCDVTGKPVGEDLREGKPTVLVAAARRRAGARHRGLLDRYGASDLTASEVSALQSLFVDCGAAREVEELIDDLVERSLSALATSGLTLEARQALADLALYVARRDR